jgi:hypothetical protein
MTPNLRKHLLKWEIYNFATLFFRILQYYIEFTELYLAKRQRDMLQI